MDRQAGFTLIELMIAVALSAILLSMAVPAMNTFVSNSRQTGAVNDFLASMHLARSTAITMNTRVTVCPSSDGENCAAVAWDQGWIAFTDGDSDQTVDVGETIVSTSAGDNGLAIASGEFGDFLMFRPNGRAMHATVDNNSGEFMVCDHRGAAHAKVLIVDLSGRPRVSDKKMDGSAPDC